ncbi:MAG: response regulator [Nitrospirota bacterium]
MRVLLVDDEVDFVKTLAQRLEMRQLKTDAVHSGEEAVSFAERQAPDVVVLDLKMPGMDGIETLKMIKKTCPDTQVIILSAHGSERDKESAECFGAYGFLKKPVEIEALMETIKSAYRKKCEMTL